MSSKNDVINGMIDILNIAKEQPIIMVAFKISAPTADIEEHLLTKCVDLVDWNSNPLSEEEIETAKKNMLTSFLLSEGYRENGTSDLYMSCTFTPNSITFNAVRNIMECKGKSFPKNSTFVGPFEKCDPSKIDDYFNDVYWK